MLLGLDRHIQAIPGHDLSDFAPAQWICQSTASGDWFTLVLIDPSCDITHNWQLTLQYSSEKRCSILFAYSEILEDKNG